MTAVLGLDIGGTKIAGLLANSSDRVLAFASVSTPRTSPDQLVQVATDLVADLLAQAALANGELAALGVGIPGQVNTVDGSVSTAVNLNLDHYPLGMALADRLGVPVIVENDVRAAAVGAYNHLFPTDSSRSLVFFNLGTGVSAGVVLNGRLYRGRHGMAGEVGHIIIEPDGRLCNCGQRGCLETLIAGPALMAAARQVLLEATVTSPADLYRAAAAGHAAAAAQIAQISQKVALAIQWLMLTYDVDKIVLGGGVTHMGAPFLVPVLAELNRLRSASPLLQTMLTADLVKVLPADFNTGAWGAIALARTTVPDQLIYSQSEGGTKK